MARRSHDYDDDPTLENTPFSVDDLSDLAHEIPKSLLKDRDAVRHIVRRALATAAQLRRVRMEFDNELRRRSAMIPATGGATVSANPEMAARFMSPEQLSSLFDKFAQEKLAALDHARKNAEALGQRAEDVVREAARIASMPETDPATATQLRQLVERFETPGGTR